MVRILSVSQHPCLFDAHVWPESHKSNICQSPVQGGTAMMGNPVSPGGSSDSKNHEMMEPLRCKTQWDYGHQVCQQKPWNFPSLVGPHPAVLVRQEFCEESSMSGTACLCKSRPMSPNTAPAAKSGQPRSRKTAVTSYDHQILPPSRQVLSLPSFTWLLLYYFFLYLSFLTLPLYWQFHYCPFLYLATTLLFLSLLVCSFAVLFLDCSLAVLSKSAHRKFFN